MCQTKLSYLQLITHSVREPMFFNVNLLVGSKLHMVVLREIYVKTSEVENELNTQNSVSQMTMIY